MCFKKFKTTADQTQRLWFKPMNCETSCLETDGRIEIEKKVRRRIEKVSYAARV